MRPCLLLAFLFAALPTSAQGVYLASGSGASVGYARATVSTNEFGRRYSTSTDAVTATLESVAGRGQVALGASYSSPRRGVSVYGLSVNLGYLALHQHRGDAVTLALNGGVGGAAVTGEGVTEATSLVAVVGPELGVAFALGSFAELVPSASFGVTVPIGAEERSTATVAGGAVGLSLRSGAGLRFVMEPGYAVSDGVGTLSFSLKVFMEE